MRRIAYTRIERWPAGHYNLHKNLVVRFRRRDFELEGGNGANDDINVYRDGAQVYVLCVNPRMPYVGLAVYDLASEPTTDRKCSLGAPPYASLDPSGEVFLQYSQDQEELGAEWWNKAPHWLVRKLLPYADEG